MLHILTFHPSFEESRCSRSIMTFITISDSAGNWIVHTSLIFTADQRKAESLRCKKSEANGEWRKGCWPNLKTHERVKSLRCACACVRVSVWETPGCTLFSKVLSRDVPWNPASIFYHTRTSTHAHVQRNILNGSQAKIIMASSAHSFFSGFRVRTL